jgi:trehalose/maltose hydrolase-like predicted phosphorylase
MLPDEPTLQRQIRAAQFYLQESIRPGTDWSISPVGLSSSGYNDHVFWDAEAWMYPSLLLLHPDVASSVVNYRPTRLPAPAPTRRPTSTTTRRGPTRTARR